MTISLFEYIACGHDGEMDSIWKFIECPAVYYAA